MLVATLLLVISPIKLNHREDVLMEKIELQHTLNHMATTITIQFGSPALMSLSINLTLDSRNTGDLRIEKKVYACDPGERK